MKAVSPRRQEWAPPAPTEIPLFLVSQRLGDKAERRER